MCACVRERERERERATPVFLQLEFRTKNWTKKIMSQHLRTCALWLHYSLSLSLNTLTCMQVYTHTHTHWHRHPHLLAHTRTSAISPDVSVYYKTIFRNISKPEGTNLKFQPLFELRDEKVAQKVAKVAPVLFSSIFFRNKASSDFIGWIRFQNSDLSVKIDDQLAQNP